MKRFFLGCLIFISLVSFVSPARAEVSDSDKRISEYERQKLEYLQKLEDLKQSKTSLKNEISYFDTQINLAQIQIDETQARLSDAESQLAVLESEIGDLTSDIASLENSIEGLKQEISSLAVRRYKDARTSNLDLFLTAASIGEIWGKLKYLSAIEAKDSATVSNLKDAKVAAQQEKDVLDTKRQEVEAVRNEIDAQKRNLESQRLALNSQRVGKASLLRLTQNDETKYQKLLAEVEAEIAAIRKVVSNIANLKFARHVERGDVLGVQGNTGIAKGDHLHFAVYHSPYVFYQDMEDPMSYFSDGRLAWPIQAVCDPGAYQCVDGHSISQPYGVSDISRYLQLYPGDFHDAVDMFGPAGSLIYAAESGDVAYGTDMWGGNYAMVKHSNGLITMYWHLK